MSIKDLKQAMIEARGDQGSPLIAREEASVTAEIQAQLVIAQKFHRDEVAAVERIDRAFSRVSLAERSEYEYNRGGQTITGPSIHALVAIAQQWGNMAFEWREIERRNGESTVVAYAWDMQTNTRRSTGFTVPHRIDLKGGNSRPCRDDREIYELVANMASRRMRSCLQQVIPQDLVDAAIEKARETLTDKIELSAETREKMLMAFARFNINQSQIEKRIGRKYENVTRNQYLGLRRIYQSIKDGVSNPEDFFQELDVSALKRAIDENKSTSANPLKPKREPEPEPEPKQEPEIETIVDQETGEQTFFSQIGGYWNKEVHSWPPKVNSSGQWRKRRGAAQVDSDTQPTDTPPFGAEEEAEIEVKL